MTKLTTTRSRMLRQALLCTSALVFLPVSLAGADDFTVPNGTTETTTITLPLPFDTLFIEQGGTIDTTGAGTNGVDASNHDQTVNNAGTINAGRYGINSTRANATITNNGTIKAGFRGFYSFGSNAILTNNGLIAAENQGIWSGGNDAIIVNNGTITNKSNGSSAIYSIGAGVKLTNNGSVNSQFRGISILKSDAKVINNGLIYSKDEGIYSSGTNAEITNRGTIIAGDGEAAILVAGTGSTLKLRAGSVLDGGVRFQATGATLDIGTGLNLYLDYSGSIETLYSAIPIVHDEANTVIYTVDPTGFALAQSFVQTTAEAVHGAVRTGSGRGNRFGGGFGGQSSFAYGADAPGFEATGPRGWV
ncbi:MAG: hypothetical protein NXI27_31875, partial [Alphaproteobacteria bacterium]|nr:hypothetical protein [Alphaproteobacteria bacterium]